MNEESDLRVGQSYPKPLDAGQIIHGFAEGAFGRDHFGCYRVEAVGPDWVVVRNSEGAPDLDFASGRPALERIIEARDRECPNGCGDYDERPLTTWGRK